MTAKTETKVTNDIMDWIKEQGGDCFHVHGSMFQRSGEPDICGEVKIPNIVSPYIHIKWEVKTVKGKPSKLQMYRLDKYVKRGYCAGIVTSIDDSIKLIQEYILNGNNANSWIDTVKKYG